MNIYSKKLIKNADRLDEISAELRQAAADRDVPTNITPLTDNPLPAELKDWRAARGYTQQMLADRLGVRVAAVTRWEAAQRPFTAYFWLALAGIDALDKQAQGDE